MANDANLTPWLMSNFSMALSRPIVPICTRSSMGSRELRKRRAMLRTNGR